MRHEPPIAVAQRVEGLLEQSSCTIRVVSGHDVTPDIAAISDDSGPGDRGQGSGWDEDQRSTSPTTKKIDPRMAIRSGTSVPGSIAGITLTLENEAVRIFSRYGSFFPSPTT